MDIVKALAQLDKDFKTTDYIKETIKLLNDFFTFPLAGFMSRSTELPEVLGNIPERQLKAIESIVLKTLPKNVLVINDTLPAPWGEIARIGYKSLVIVPVVMGMNLAGAFVFPDRKRHDFTDKALYQLECCSSMISSMLEMILRRVRKPTTLLIKPKKSAIAGVIITDKDGTIIESNEEFDEIIGTNSGLQSGKKLADLDFLANVKSTVAAHLEMLEKSSGPITESFAFQPEGAQPTNIVFSSDKFTAGQTVLYHHIFQPESAISAEKAREEARQATFAHKVLSGIHRISIEPMVLEGIDMALSDIGNFIKADRLSLVEVRCDSDGLVEELVVFRQWLTDPDNQMFDYNNSPFRLVIPGIKNGSTINGFFEGLFETGLRFAYLSPVFTKGTFWGFISCESAKKEINLTQTQLRQLSIFGEMAVGTAIGNETRDKVENDIENYKLFIKESPISMAVISLKTGEFLETSNGFTLLTGWRADEVIGKSSTEIELYENPENRKEFIDKIIRNGRIIGFETTIVTKTGENKDVLLSGEAVFARNERLAITTAQDVSEMKHAQQKLRISEELSRAIIRSLPEYIIITDLDGIIIDAENGLALTSKVDQKELCGKSLTIFLPETIKKQTREAVDHVKTSGKCQSFEFDAELSGIKKTFTSRISITENRQLIFVFQDITTFRTSERLLEGTKNKFHTIFNMSPQGIVIVDKEFERIADCNNEFVKLSGLTGENLVGEPYKSLTLFRNNHELTELFDIISRNGNTSNTEIVIKDLKGLPRNIVVSSSRIKLGGDDAHIVQFTDVTELSNIRRELSESDERFKNVVVNSTYPSAIFELSTGKIILSNDQLDKMLGLGAENLPNASVQSIGLFDDTSYSILISDLKEYGVIRDRIATYTPKKDPAIDILYSFKTIKFSGKDCAFASLQDITPLKLANKAIMESEERYRLLVENSPLGTLFIERDGKVVSANKAFLQMFGFEESDDIIGLNMLANQLFSKSEITEDISKCISENETLISERQVNINESQIYVVVYATPFHDENGAIHRIQLIFEDITITKMVEFELKQAISQAQSASSAKSEFLANMSHEIRTPLNALLGFVQLLSGDVKDEKQRQYISAIETAAQALNSMTASLLDISKIEAGKIVIDQSAQDIANLIRDSILLTEPHSQELQNTIVFNFSNEPSVYMIDPDRFKQIMINLLGNAVKFTKNGVITVTLKIQRGEGSHDSVTIDVDDTGIGIPPEMRDTVFEPFMQVDSSATRKFGGTGLGLAIVRGLIEKMNGSIRIIDKKNPGTLFRIVFDLERVMSQSIRIAKSKDVVVCLKNPEEVEIVKSVLFHTTLNIHIADSLPENIKFLKLIVTEAELFEECKHKELSDQIPVIVVGTETEGQKIAGVKRPLERNTIITAISKLFPEEPELAFLNLAGKKVLIVEDNQLNIVLLRDILVRMGCQVLVSTSGIEAVDIMKQGELDACLMDVQMPDLSGLDATMQMRYFEETSTRTRLPIIALTAYATKEDRERCLNAGMDDFVAKPFKMGDLLTALSKAIYKSHLDSQKGVIEKLAERLLIDPEKLREFLGNFVQTSIKSLGDLEELINTGEFTQALKITHTIKGMAYVEDLHKSIVKLEGTLRRQDKTASFIDLVELRNNLEKLDQEIQNNLQ